MAEIKGNIRNVTQKLTGNIKSIGAKGDKGDPGDGRYIYTDSQGNGNITITRVGG